MRMVSFGLVVAPSAGTAAAAVIRKSLRFTVILSFVDFAVAGLERAQITERCGLGCSGTSRHPRANEAASRLDHASAGPALPDVAPLRRRSAIHGSGLSGPRSAECSSPFDCARRSLLSQT